MRRDRIREAWDYLPCEKCRALDGDPCRGPSSEVTNIHKGRKKKAGR